MTESIDHKASAEGNLGLDWHHEGAATMVAEAQVHATLYLAEQQRIANLIALWQGSPVQEECIATGPVDGGGTALTDAKGVLAPEIKKALGLV